MSILIKIDKGMDRVPGLSTANNLVSLGIKGIYPLFSENLKNNSYIAHVKNKEVARCAYLLVPVVSNVSVYLDDLDHKWSCTRIRDAEQANLNEFSMSLNRNIPQEIGRLTMVSEMTLDIGTIKTIPSQIGLLTNLTKLDLFYNNLKTLPAEISLLTKLTELDLSQNKHIVLPPEIGRLSNLTDLNLANNKLMALPAEIGGLTNLSILNLAGNQFKALPAEIGALTKLTEFDLRRNKLSSLPEEIGLLTRLEDFYLSGNKFTGLPLPLMQLVNLSILCLDENPIKTLCGIGQMHSLTILDISKSPLTSLPAEIGRLRELQTLKIEKCPKLRHLPMSLGEIPALGFIADESTPVPERFVDAILGQCRQMRNSEAHVPTLLLKWRTYGNFSAELNLNLNEQEACTLNEWLVRLERTQDFALSQTLLAKTVCALLADLHHAEFRESFFNQAEANNACCEDRAAMALNEIYTTWLHLCQTSRLPEREKLQKIAGVARTLCLRRKLQRLIQKHNRQERETVEIFLYYEIAFKTSLKLETAIQSMSYGAIGRRNWINEAALIQEVKRDFYEDLVEMPLFDKLVEFNGEKFQKKLEELGECPKGSEESTPVLNYKARQGEIMMEWKKEKIEIAKKLVIPT